MSIMDFEYSSDEDKYDILKEMVDTHSPRLIIDASTNIFSQKSNTKNPNTHLSHIERRLIFVNNRIRELEQHTKNVSPIDKNLLKKFITEKKSLEVNKS